MIHDNSKNLLSNLGILTISNFASKVLIFLLVPLYTNILTTDEYGTYDLVVSTVSLLAPILSMNIIDAVMRFLMDKNCSQKKVATIGIKFVSYSVVAVALFLLVMNRVNIWRKLQGLGGYIFLYYTFYVLNQYFIQLAKGLEQVKTMGIAGLLGTIVMLITNVLFLIVFKWKLPGFFLANILSQAIPVCYFFLKINFWKFITITEKDKYLTRNMLIYCTPLIASVIGWWINSGSDKYVVTFYYGLAANGLLSVAYKIPSILNTFQGIFIQAWQISAIREYGKKEMDRFYGNIFLITNVLMCAACSWLILLTKPLARLLYAKDFYIAWKFVPFLLISCVMNCASGILGPILSAKKDSKSMSVSAIYGAGVNVVLNIVLIHLLGVQGVTIATAISSYIIYRVRKHAVGGNITIESYASVLSTWGLLCIQAFLEVYTTFWYVEVILMVIMLIININKLKQLLTLLFRETAK